MAEQIQKAAHYRSWYEVAKKISDPEDRLMFYEAIDAYRFDGVEPEGLSPLVDILWTAIKPSIDADIDRRCEGAQGGRPKKPRSADSETVVSEIQKPCAKGYAENGKTEVTGLSEPSFSENAGKEENHPLKTQKPPFSDLKNPPFFKTETNDKENENDKENVDVDVKGVVSDSEPVENTPSCGNPVEKSESGEEGGIEKISSWLRDKGLFMDAQSVSQVAGISFAMDPSGTAFLDYMLSQMETTTVKGQPYRSLDANGKRKVFRSAVLKWEELRDGFPAWRKEQDRREIASRSPPASCPICKGRLAVSQLHPGGYCAECGTEMRFSFQDGDWKPYYAEELRTAAV